MKPKPKRQQARPQGKRAVTPAELVQAFEQALLELLKEGFIGEQWLRFSDRTPLPDGTEQIASLAFRAGYPTALDHVNGLFESVRPGLE